MIQDWFFDSLMTWWPLALFWFALFLISSAISKKVELDGYYRLVASYLSSKKVLVVALLLIFFVSVISPTNRPKNDVSPDMSAQQYSYKAEVEQSASKEVVEVKRIEDDFEERKEQTKKMFEY